MTRFRRGRDVEGTRRREEVEGGKQNANAYLRVIWHMFGFGGYISSGRPLDSAFFVSKTNKAGERPWTGVDVCPADLLFF